MNWQRKACVAILLSVMAISLAGCLILQDHNETSVNADPGIDWTAGFDHNTPDNLYQFKYSSTDSEYASESTTVTYCVKNTDGSVRFTYNVTMPKLADTMAVVQISDFNVIEGVAASCPIVLYNDTAKVFSLTSSVKIGATTFSESNSLKDYYATYLLGEGEGGWTIGLDATSDSSMPLGVNGLIISTTGPVKFTGGYCIYITLYADSLTTAWITKQVIHLTLIDKDEAKPWIAVFGTTAVSGKITIDIGTPGSSSNRTHAFCQYGHANGALYVGSAHYFDMVDLLSNTVMTSRNLTFTNCVMYIVPFSDDGNSFIQRYADGVGTGEYMYVGDRAASSVGLPEGIKTISAYSFYKCTELKSITIPKTVERIGISAFENCTSLEEITFETGGTSALTLSGDGSHGFTFGNCTALTSVVLPARLYNMVYYMFSGCSKLAGVDFETIADESGYLLYSVHICAFSNLSTAFKTIRLPITSLSDFNVKAIPNSVSSIETIGTSDKFLEKDGVTYMASEADGYVVFNMPANLTGALTLPDGMKVVAASQFSGCGITSLVVPASVTTIGKDAFSSCPLTSVSFTGDSQLLKISQGAFYKTKLSTISLPSSLTEIGNKAFQYSSLESITFNSSTLKIGECAFMYTPLSSVVFSDMKSSLTIGAQAFKSTSLEAIDLPSGTTSLGIYAFQGTDISSIAIPAAVSNIAVYASSSSYTRQGSPFSSETTTITVAEDSHYFCVIDGVLYKKVYDGTTQTGLDLYYIPYDVTSVTLASNVISMELGVFRGHANLQTVSFGAGFSCDIGKGEFRDCSTLDRVTFDATATTKAIGEGAFMNTYLSQINLPDSVTTVGSSAFYGCTNLKVMTINDTSKLTSVGEKAFYGCTSLTRLNLPSGIETVGSQALGSCTMLASLTMSADGAHYRVVNNAMLISKSGELTYVVSKVSKITLPTDVCSIDRFALVDTNLSSVAVDSSNAVYSTDANGAVLLDNSGSEAIFIPSNVKELIMPSSVTSIRVSSDWFDVLGKASALTSLTWDGGSSDLTVMGGTLSLSELTLKTTGQITLGDFQKCNSLKTVSITASKVLFRSSLCLFSGTSYYDLIISVDSFADGSTTKGIVGNNINSLTLSVKTVPEGFTVGGLFTDGKYGNVTISYAADAASAISLDAVTELTGTTVHIDGSAVSGFSSDIAAIYKSGSDTPWIELTFDSADGLVSTDVGVSVSGGSFAGIDNGRLKVLLTGAETTITIAEKAASDTQYTVTFNLCGGVLSDGGLSSLAVSSGRTIKTTDLTRVSNDLTRSGYTFEGWYCSADLAQVYDRDPINADTTLYARWSLDEGYAVTYEELNGLVTAHYADGRLFFNGENVEAGTVLTFSVEQGNGVELKGWTVKINSERTTAESAVDLQLTVTGPAAVSANIRFYSTSNSLINITNLPTPESEDIVMIWENSYNIDTSMMVWTGLPSTPLIVDDYVFVRASNDLVKLDINTGNVLAKVTTPGSTVTAFYHYLGYGGGVVVDYSTGKAYDTSLNELYDLPKNFTAVFYNGGYFYGLCDGSLWKFDAATGSLYDGASWKDGVSETWHGVYGTTSTPVFTSDYIYFIEITGQDREGRAIGGVNLETGVKTQVTLTKMENYYLDDGWLTYYEHGGTGYLFVTGYTNGLFDSGSGTSYSIIDCVELNNDGTFNADSERWINLKNNGTASALVVVDGRGYINVTGSGEYSDAAAAFYVIDVDKLIRTEQSVWTESTWKTTETTKFEDFSYSFVIYTEKSVASHGSIVVSTAYYDATGKIYIYLLPYNSGEQALYIFTDYADKTVGASFYKTSPVGLNYGSQAIRVGPEGQILWYTDSGTLYCYAGLSTMTDYYLFVQNEDKAVMYHGEGNSLTEALKNACRTDDVTVTVNETDVTVTIDGNKYYLYYFDPISKNDTSAVAIKSVAGVSMSQYRIFFLSSDIKDYRDINPDSTWYAADSDDDDSALQEILTYPKEYAGKSFCVKYKIAYDLSGGTEQADLRGSVCEQGKTVTVPFYSGTKYGYTFIGWSNGSETYTYSGDSPLTFTMGSADITLTAIWLSHPVNKIELNTTEKSMLAGSTSQLNVTVYPTEAENKNIVWSSDNTDVASVVNGKVTALSTGTAIITAMAADGGAIATCKVIVSSPIAVTDITVSAASVIVTVGSTVTLTAAVTPVDATVQTVTWTVNDSHIAVVDGGKITGIAAGTTTISVAAASGSPAVTCTVTVIDPADPGVTVPATEVGNTCSALLSADAVKALVQTGNGVTVVSASGAISISQENLRNLTGGDVEVAIENVDSSVLTAAQQAAAGGRQVYSITVSQSEKQVTEFGDMITITLPYTLGSGEDAAKLEVCCLLADGTLEIFACTYDASAHTVSFQTDHLSYYFVKYTGGNGSSFLVLAVVGIAIVVLAAIAVVASLFVRSRRTA